MNTDTHNLTPSEGQPAMPQSTVQKPQWRRCRHRQPVAMRSQVVAATLKAREMLTYSLNFTDSRLSSLTAWGDGNVDLYVFDQDGELVAFDNGADKQAHCAWLATAHAPYMVWLVNTERFSMTCSVALQAQ